MRIAIIGQKDHTEIGGIQNYNRLLNKVLGNENEIVEFPVYPVNKNKKVIKKQFEINDELRNEKFKKLPFDTIKKINNFISRDEFDVYILSSMFYNRKTLKFKKVIFVQHANEKYYTNGQDGLNYHIVKIIRGLLNLETLRSPLKVARNSVAFDDVVPPGTLSYQKNNRNGFLWAGRFDYKFKGIKQLINIEKITSKNIDVYGSGDSSFITGNMHFKGSYSSKDQQEIFSKYKGFILTSQDEGCETVAAEALSAGLPVVMFENSTAAMKFYKSCPGVFVAPKNDVVAFSKLIDYIDNLNDNQLHGLSVSIVSWNKKANNLESFADFWKKTIKNI